MRGFFFGVWGGVFFFFGVREKGGGGGRGIGISNGIGWNDVKFHNVIDNCFGVHRKIFPINFHLKNFKIN